MTALPVFPVRACCTQHRPAAAHPQVLDEIGIDLAAAAPAAPQKRVAAKQQQQQQRVGAGEEAEEDADLAKLMAALKG